MSLLKRRTCFYIQYFWVFRTKNGYKPLDEIINFKKIEKILKEYFKKIKQNRFFLAKFYLVFNFLFLFLNVNSLRVLKELFDMVSSHAFNRGEYAQKSDNFLQIIFSTACDPFKADLKIAKNCHVGIIYKNKGEGIKIMDENGIYLLSREQEKEKKRKCV